MIVCRPGPGAPSSALYEFGGPAGMDIAHRQFCADTQGVLAYARLDTPALGRRELSVLLIGAMLATAGLDWFERGDVFARVAAMRPALPDGSGAKMAQLAEQVRALTTVPAQAVSAAGTLGSFVGNWLGAFESAGRQFAQAAGHGDLGREIRAILARMMIFHWNRLALPASTQGILARAARDAFLPPDQGMEGATLRTALRYFPLTGRPRLLCQPLAERIAEVIRSPAPPASQTPMSWTKPPAR